MSLNPDFRTEGLLPVSKYFDTGQKESVLLACIYYLDTRICAYHFHRKIYKYTSWFDDLSSKTYFQPFHAWMLTTIKSRWRQLFPSQRSNNHWMSLTLHGSSKVTTMSEHGIRPMLRLMLSVLILTMNWSGLRNEFDRSKSVVFNKPNYWFRSKLHN